jgi:hypothetical protein
MSDRFIGFGGVILFALVIYYVNQETVTQGAEKHVLFAAIFLGTIMIGAMSDRVLWGAIGWIAIACLLPVIYICVFHVREPAPLGLFALLLHGLDGLWIVFTSFSNRIANSRLK